MPVDGSEFMAVATGMVRTEAATEIELRCAGSRAYYALYHAALGVIQKKGVPLIKVKNAGDHASVIATLCSMGPSAKSIGEAMAPLKRFRTDCDYELSLQIRHRKAFMMVAQARELIGRLGRL